jgi:hypothetical protein
MICAQQGKSELALVVYRAPCHKSNIEFYCVPVPRTCVHNYVQCGFPIVVMRTSFHLCIQFGMSRNVPSRWEIGGIYCSRNMSASDRIWHLRLRKSGHVATCVLERSSVHSRGEAYCSRAKNKQRVGESSYLR